LQRGLDRIFDRAPVGQITLIRFNNFSRARTTMPSSLRENLGIAPRCSNPLSIATLSS